MIKNIFNTFFLRIFNAFINLVLVIIISRYLGAEVKGEQGLLLTSITLLHILMSIVGLGAITYLIPRLEYTQLIIPSYLWCIVIAFGGYYVLPFVQPEAGKFYLDISILTFILTIFNINIGSLVAREKIIIANRISFVQICLSIGSIVFLMFVMKIFSVYAYIYSLYISYTVSLALSYFLVFNEFKINSSLLTLNHIRFGFKQLFYYGFFNQLDVFAQMLSFRLSYYVLSSYVGNKEVGIYSVAVSIAESIWLISRSISSVHNARVANTFNLNENIKLTMQFIKAASVLTIIGLIVLIALPPNFYAFVFGKEFFSVRNIIISISPGIAFFSASFMISGLFGGIGKQYINSIASVIGLVVTVGAAYLLIPRYGIYGAGVTASLSYFSTTVVKIIYFKKQSNFPWTDFLITRSDVNRYISEIGALKNRLIRRTV